ncbi:MAG: polysaccharide deacetylase family protein [Actinomycetota bacterium]|nr:polysaccharide deacetylase family protein [Actinomycetota bacterium]
MEPGVLVISLDFELHWGVRDLTPVDGPYRANLLGARQAVPRMLELFERFELGATWATVGFLFAASRDELERFLPEVRPAYVDANLSPYHEPIGATEQTDPFHLARSLVDVIRASPRQELASHTFSHYYCLEPGQDEAAFRADLESAVRIAGEQGSAFESIVFPRHQLNPAYVDVIRELGFSCYRGNHPGSLFSAHTGAFDPMPVRLLRLLDAYVDIKGPSLVGWDELLDGTGLCNVPASRFLRPFRPALAPLEPLRLRRITKALDEAAASSRIFHLWWHPHNFGIHLEENLRFLERVLTHFARLRDDGRLRSMTMGEVAARAKARLS